MVKKKTSKSQFVQDFQNSLDDLRAGRFKLAENSDLFN